MVLGSAAPKDPPKTTNSGWRYFWSTVDAGAWVGTIGTAVAFLLTQEALLVGGPVLLPLIALYASRERSRLDIQAAQSELQRQVAAALKQVTAISEESAIAIADEVLAAVEEAYEGHAAPDESFVRLENKFVELEGSVLNVSNAVKGAREDAAEQQNRVVRDISATLGALRRDLGTDLRKASGEELAVLAGLDTRLVVSILFRRQLD